MMNEWEKYLNNMKLDTYTHQTIYESLKKMGQISQPQETTIEMTESKRKRIERKQKLKRVFNYDAEMGFLKSFLKLKSKDIESKNITTDEFLETTRKMFVETQQVSDVIFDYFKDELIITEKIKNLTAEKNIVQLKLSELQKEIKQLQDVLSDDDSNEDNEYDDIY